MSYYLIGFALIIAFVDWFAVAQKWKKLEYFAKPGVILILITWLIINGGYLGPKKFFLIGLLFSLAGDIFLMLPDDKFLAGLVSFLIAHLAYIGGFSIPGFQITTITIVIIVLVGLVGIVAVQRVLKGLKVTHNENLRLPVILYAVIISIMLISALSTLVVPNPAWKIYPALFVSIGAILFFISDLSLAWNKFVHQITHGGLLVIITYHLAQILITLGSGVNFLI
jgi:uncharacterized membrane protein YhhN